MKIKTEKPNCYDCKWRGELVGDAHSCCNHPKVATTKDEPLNQIFGLLAAVGRIDISIAGNPLGVTGNRHGIKHGWFCWPMNFDPVWLDTCNGFERKGVNAVERNKNR